MRWQTSLQRQLARRISHIAKMPIRGPVSVKHYKKETAEVIKLGPLLCYIFEDGSNTDNRVGCVTIELPKGASGPPMHWHRFHDECFLVTKGWE